MELVKNVFFNTDKLVENAKVKISYVGKLFQENSSEVYLHYGFGSNWDNVNEIKMEKTMDKVIITVVGKQNLDFKLKLNYYQAIL